MIISTDILQDLMKSSIDKEYAEKLGWHQVQNAKELKKLIGFSSMDKQDILQSSRVLAIPYPDTNFARIRLYPPIRDGKYLQPKDVPPEPYILPKVAELKEKPHKPIIITEGEKKTVCLIKHGYNAIGLPGVWQFKKGNEFLLSNWNWRNRVVYVVFDNDAVFNSQVLQAEIELSIRLYLLGAKVKVIRLPVGNEKGVDDFITAKGKEAFDKLMDKAKPFFEAYTQQDYKEILNRLKHLYDSKLFTFGELESVISIFAKSLRIKKELFLKDLAIDTKDKEEFLPIVEELTPYKGDIDSKELIESVENILRDHVYMPDEYYLPLSLYVMFTYIFEHFPTAPMLLITSPTKRCGKTTLLRVLSALCSKSLPVSNISAAAVFRIVEKYKPTLLIDEADAGLSENEELRGIINAGHTKDTAYVIRIQDKSKNFEPIRFDTFSPKIVAMIGLPKDKHNTWLDRSILIKLDRKPNNVKLKRLPLVFSKETRELREKLLKWAYDNKENFDDVDYIRETEDKLALLNDRAKDNWLPLAVIAKSLNKMDDLLGSIYKIEEIRELEDEDIRIQLLLDIQSVIDTSEEKISSRELCERLNELDDRPYIEMNHGKGIKPTNLARMLKPFGVRPKKVRLLDETLRGYEIDDFKKVFSLYIYASKWNSGTMASEQEKSKTQEWNGDKDVPFIDSQETALEQECSVVPSVNTLKREGKQKINPEEAFIL